MNSNKWCLVNYVADPLNLVSNPLVLESKKWRKQQGEDCSRSRSTYRLIDSHWNSNSRQWHSLTLFSQITVITPYLIHLLLTSSPSPSKQEKQMLTPNNKQQAEAPPAPQLLLPHTYHASGPGNIAESNKNLALAVASAIIGSSFYYYVADACGSSIVGKTISKVVILGWSRKVNLYAFLYLFTWSKSEEKGN